MSSAGCSSQRHNRDQHISQLPPSTLHEWSRLPQSHDLWSALALHSTSLAISAWERRGLFELQGHIYARHLLETIMYQTTPRWQINVHIDNYNIQLNYLARIWTACETMQSETTCASDLRAEWNYLFMPDKQWADTGEQCQNHCCTSTCDKGSWKSVPNKKKKLRVPG